MAKIKRIISNQSSFFFLDGRLHRIIHVNRAGDTILAWDFGNEERRMYLLSDVKRKMQYAFNVSEAARLIGRHPDRIWRAIRSGDIPAPVKSYTLDERRSPGLSYYSEDGLFKIHDYFLTVHRGRPRKDGRVTPGLMPNRQELKSIIRTHNVLYIKNKEGEFVPVWKDIL